MAKRTKAVVVERTAGVHARTLDPLPADAWWPTQDVVIPRLGPKAPTIEPEILVRLLEEVKSGQSMVVACSYVGISYHTVRQWLYRGRDEARQESRPKRISIYQWFWERYLEAQRWCERENVRVVTKAREKGDWRAAMAYLKSSPYTRKRWSESTRVKLSGEVGVVPVPTQIRNYVDNLAPAEREQRLAHLVRTLPALAAPVTADDSDS